MPWQTHCECGRFIATMLVHGLPYSILSPGYMSGNYAFIYAFVNGTIWVVGKIDSSAGTRTDTHANNLLFGRIIATTTYGVRPTAVSQKRLPGITRVSHHGYTSTFYLEGIFVDIAAMAETPTGVATDNVVESSLIGLEQYLAADWPTERGCSLR